MSWLVSSTPKRPFRRTFRKLIVSKTAGNGIYTFLPRLPSDPRLIEGLKDACDARTHGASVDAGTNHNAETYVRSSNIAKLLTTTSFQKAFEHIHGVSCVSYSSQSQKSMYSLQLLAVAVSYSYLRTDVASGTMYFFLWTKEGFLLSTVRTGGRTLVLLDRRLGSSCRHRLVVVVLESLLHNFVHHEI